jgi:hypothetical protein
MTHFLSLSATFTPTGTSAASFNAGPTLIVVTVAIAVMLIGVGLVVCLRRKCANQVYATNGEIVTYPGKEATSTLIPPLFYTEEIADPLMQQDLRERLIEGDGS